ncbi:MAG: nucleoside hydrolase [Myxococcota bacterium]
MPLPILFDTDIGSDVDDALALGVVLGAPEALELVAVTTVGREPEQRARIAARLLGLAGRAEVEVCAGERTPLLRPERAFGWWGNEEAGIHEGPEAKLSDEPAAERIVRAARETADLEIVAVGPMTNVARALALCPSLPRRVAGITIMGGHIRQVAVGERICEPGVDYNLCSDPEASMAVLGAGFRTRLVTADVTLQTWLREGDLERMSGAGPVARAIADQVRLWAPVQRTIFVERLGGTLAPDNVAFLHDPLTVLALFDENPLHFEELQVLPTISRGVLRTLEVDAALGIGSPMKTATAVDADLARDRIVERLLRL